MNNNLISLRTFYADGVQLDCYVERNEHGNLENFWIPREQLGLLLGYRSPGHDNSAISIEELHEKHKEELDPLMTDMCFCNAIETGSLFVGFVEIKKQIRTLYNHAGLLKLCEYSGQPNAEKCTRIICDIAEEIFS